MYINEHLQPMERRLVARRHVAIEERSIEAALELFCVISVSARHLAASK